MIAKIILATSLCFALFIMARFWQHDAAYMTCTNALHLKKDSIFQYNNKKLTSQIHLNVKLNPKYAHWQAKKDVCDRYLDTLLTFLSAKTKPLATQKSLSDIEIDSLVNAQKRFNQKILDLIDPKESKDFSTKFMTGTTLSMNSSVNPTLQKQWLQTLKTSALIDAIMLGNYCLDKASGCYSYPSSPYSPLLYTQNLSKNNQKREILLADNTAEYTNDSIWINGIPGRLYDFIPQKTGYHYLTVKAKIQDKSGATIVLRDTFKVHIVR
jgi:hypothetical protein